MTALAPAWPFDGIAPGSAGAVFADVPWDHGITQRLGGKGRTPAAAWKRYSTLSVDAVCGLPVGDLLADSGHLWLAVTNQVIAAGTHAQVLEAWGARPVTVLTWCKPGRNGLGKYLRSSTEHVVFAVKGWGSVPDTPWPTTWLKSPRLSHSQKPPALLDVIESVSKPPFVELFARQLRLSNDWQSWGHGYELGVTA